MVCNKPSTHTICLYLFCQEHDGVSAFFVKLKNTAVNHDHSVYGTYKNPLLFIFSCELIPWEASAIVYQNKENIKEQ